MPFEQGCGCLPKQVSFLTCRMEPRYVTWPGHGLVYMQSSFAWYGLEGSFSNLGLFFSHVLWGLEGSWCQSMKDSTEGWAFLLFLKSH